MRGIKSLSFPSVPTLPALLSVGAKQKEGSPAVHPKDSILRQAEGGYRRRRRTALPPSLLRSFGGPKDSFSSYGGLLRRIGEKGGKEGVHPSAGEREAPFQTRKSEDFYFRSLELHFNKLRYFYLPEGRVLTYKISLYIIKGNTVQSLTGLQLLTFLILA
uniref:LAGLIDADG homing endonuclease n=1 Tax=Tephrocybe rancida TaxID=117070 RepID=A0A386TY81_9AGAR|nr:LAGLIDADG homing endonuclease [Tephrocybe rancida]AYE93186.1 LAGLIDADG homing endonuclease [Tephrocybe rancida]